MNSELFDALDVLAREKNINRDDILEAIKRSLVTACKKQYNSTAEGENVIVEVNEVTHEFEVFADQTVVDEYDYVDELTQIPLAKARMKNPAYNLGDICRVQIETKDFGRIVTQEAKNIIVQAIREKERESLQVLYADKDKEVITGVVQRYVQNSGNISLDLGKVEALLTEKEMIHYKYRDENGKDQIRVEKFRPQQRVKVYVTEVRSTNRGPKILLSRTHREFVKRLFENEVTEIKDGIVEIKAIAREAGSRTKIAVWSNDPDVDPVGACVGVNGGRVNAIVDELGGEKIDIINWDENPALFIENALSPAKVITVMGDIEERSCLVVVPDYQLSLAIGKEGQNVRLAARLTNFKIDIKSETQARESGELMDYQEDYYDDEYDEYEDDEFVFEDDVENTGDVDLLDEEDKAAAFQEYDDVEDTENE